MVAPLTENRTLRPEPKSAGEARELTRQLCAAAQLATDICEIVVLLTSETVTNAIVHGRSEIRLRVSVGLRSVRVEVGDDNSRLPVVRPADSGALDGRGMALVEAAATRWGVSQDTHGKLVWFEVAHSPGVTPPHRRTD